MAHRFFFYCLFVLPLLAVQASAEERTVVASPSAPGESEADLLPDEDPVPVDAPGYPTTAFLEFNPADSVRQALASGNCEYNGGECDPAALQVARSALSNLVPLMELDGGGYYFEIVFEEGGEERHVPYGDGRSWLHPGDSAIAALEWNWEHFGISSPMEGRVESACGPLDYLVTFVLSPMDNGIDRLFTHIELSGSCDCMLFEGRPLETIHYMFESESDAWWTVSDLGSVQVGFELNESVCYATGYCCDAPAAGDAFPGSDNFVLSFDSPLWCTYGGGSVPIPTGFGPSMPPTSFPPVPPSGQPNPPIPGATGSPGGDLPAVPGGSATDTPPDEPGGGASEVSGGGDTPLPGTAGPILPGSGEDDSEDGSSSGEEEPPAVPPGDEAPPADEGNPPTATITLTIKATTETLAAGATVAAQGALIQINTGDPAMIAGDPGAQPDDDGFDEPEYSAIADDQGNATLTLPAGFAGLAGSRLLEVVVDASAGLVFEFPGEVTPAQVLPRELQPFVQTTTVLGPNTFISVRIPEHLMAGLQGAIDAVGANSVEVDVCINPMPLSDPYFSSEGSWSQNYPDQWGIQRVGFTPDEQSAWQLLEEPSEPVVIAVIDSGLDWNHQDIDWNDLWKNADEIPANGVDDDANGYVDDTIGWDFWDNDRAPWDVDGHGTFVAGVLFARSDNQAGITGIVRHAKLMVLKAMNAFGHTRASHVATAIRYAADNGARVINLSLGGPEQSTVVRKAIDYAYRKNVVVLVAAGNEAKPTDGQSVAGLEHALTVAAVGTDDKRSIYSNYGKGIDLAAPGDDILSLRARRTDLLKNIPGVQYTPGSAFVGSDRRYYRASGTSFATPIAAGVAALVIANRPELTADQVMRILRQSAEDVELPGVDHFTGYGVVDARAALQADPAFYIRARISGVAVTEDNGKQFVEVHGNAEADRFRKAVLEIGAGANPEDWRTVSNLRKPVRDGRLASIPATQLSGSRVWTIRLLVEHKGGRKQEYRFNLNLG